MKGVPHQKKYAAQYHDDWAWSLAIRGATDQDIADAFHVSRQTIMRWAKTTDKDGNEVLTSFGQALQTGKNAADARVEKKLYERCMGGRYEEARQIIEHDSQGRPSIKRTEVVKKEVPPDTMAIMYWLNNRKRKTGEWSQRQDVTLKTESEIDLSGLSEEELRNLAALAAPQEE